MDNDFSILSITVHAGSLFVDALLAQNISLAPDPRPAAEAPLKKCDVIKKDEAIWAPT